MLKCQGILGLVRRGCTCVPMRPKCVLRLRHSLLGCAGLACQKRFGAAPGRVSVALPDKRHRILFHPLRPCRAPNTIRTLYYACRSILRERLISPLLLVPYFVLSFLYVRPFGSNGNEVDQLLALLVLCRGNCIIKRCVDVRGTVTRAGSRCCTTLTRTSRR